MGKQVPKQSYAAEPMGGGKATPPKRSQKAIAHPKAPPEPSQRAIRHRKPPPECSSIEYSIDIGKLKELLGRDLHYNEKEILGPVLNQCCIYRVPTNLRNVNPKAYVPQVISIGPLHHGKKELIKMEKQKLRYVSEFYERTKDKETLIGFKKFIEENEKKIRNCYTEHSDLESCEFVTIILCDAVFVIEFVLKYYKSEKENDYFLTTLCVVNAIQLDLLLLENQLPFFVLEDLYKRVLLCNNGLPKTLLIPLRELFGWTVLNDDQNLCYKIQHLTDLGRHYFSLYHCKNGNEEQSDSEEENEGIIDIPCATRLRGSGVNFSNGDEDEDEDEDGCLADIRFEYTNRKMLPIPWFKELKLRIPLLTVYDPTECWIRNMMALEMCHYPQDHHVCDYISFMDDLIDDKRDVDLLVEKGIIINHLGDNAALADMFNNLCSQIVVSKPGYLDVRKKLKQHYHNHWNHAKAKLKTTYFSDLWTGTATVAAVMLLLLTLIQAICSILSLICRG